MPNVINILFDVFLLQEQYKGIHEIVAAYLDLFTTDANYQSCFSA